MTHARKKLLATSVAAIGIVYGDLGTSPLYAFRESLKGLPISAENIYGVLSLICWSLVLIICIKYVLFVLRADNEGEGGVLALLALIKKHNEKAFRAIFGIAILGTALLISDGMITPAISVVSAIEGLEVITPKLSHLTVPLSLGILFMLYFFQHFGTAKIAKYFGPIILTWFMVIGVLGVMHILKNPTIFYALNPYYGVMFLAQNGWQGYTILGAVFLVVTGGEALYADLGQFGKKSIRLSWFVLVFPSLLLNYFGQGACLLKHPEFIENPFYALSPDFFQYPLLVLATLATIIASQAVITATFSLTKQAILLDLLPKLRIIQTSSEERGHVYLPAMNTFLAIGTVSLVLYFKNSSAMAYAYGIAVNLVMLSVSFLLMFVAYNQWRWSLLKMISFFSVVFFIELGFFGANLEKIASGGWMPMVCAVLFGSVMITWYRGLTHLRKAHFLEPDPGHSAIKSHYPATDFLVLRDSLAVIITDPYDESGGKFFQYIRLNRIMAKTNLIVSVSIENYPHSKDPERYECTQLDENVYRLVLHMGFMQAIHIPDELVRASDRKVFPFVFSKDKATYFIENTNVSPGMNASTLTFFWQERFFSYLMRNSTLDIDFYHLPYHQTISIGSYFEI